MDPTYRLKFGSNSQWPNLPLSINDNPLLRSPKSKCIPSRRLLLSKMTLERPYVTGLDYISSRSSLLAILSSPEDTIVLFDANAVASNASQQQLRPIQTFKPHQEGTGTSVLVIPSDSLDQSTFWSAGTDGRVVQCDMRAAQGGTSSASLVLKGMSVIYP